MAPPTMVPDKTTLTRWKAEGLTQAQMVTRHELETGIKVSRSAMANAMIRYGLSGSHPRYHNTLPWKVSEIHLSHYAARMLRLLGRRQAGGELNPLEASRLTSWLEGLERESIIVGYDPDSVDGFLYIEKTLKDNGGFAPIRRRRVYS